MDYGFIITGAILGAAMAIIGTAVGALLTKVKKFNNPKKVMGICCAVFVAPTQSLIRSDVGKAIHDLVTPKSLLARAAENSGITEISSSNEAKRKFAEWGVDTQAGTQRLTSQGLKRLDYADLHEWNEIRYKMAETDSSLCSGFYTGNIDKARIMAGLEALGEPLLARFMKISANAASRELRDHPFPNVSEKQTEKAFLAIEKAFPDSFERFLKNLQAGTKLSESEACWTFSLWSRAAKEFAQADSESLLRLMVQQ